MIRIMGCRKQADIRGRSDWGIQEGRGKKKIVLYGCKLKGSNGVSTSRASSQIILYVGRTEKEVSDTARTAALIITLNKPLSCRCPGTRVSPPGHCQRHFFFLKVHEHACITTHRRGYHCSEIRVLSPYSTPRVNPEINP